MNIKIPEGVNLPDYPNYGYGWVASAEHEAMRLKMLMYREMYRSLVAEVSEMLADWYAVDLIDEVDLVARIATLIDARAAKGHLAIEPLTPVEQALIEANAELLNDSTEEKLWRK
jgi:hypothetical protein